jgi:HEAT repeat protein
MLFLLSCADHHRFDHLRDYEAQKDEDALIDVLIDDKDDYIRAQAAKSLGRLKSKKAIPSLIDGIRDENWTVRYFCVQSLGLIKDNRAINPLNTQRKVENDENVLREIDKALNNIKGSSKEVKR